MPEATGVKEEATLTSSTLPFLRTTKGTKEEMLLPHAPPQRLVCDRYPINLTHGVQLTITMLCSVPSVFVKEQQPCLRSSFQPRRSSATLCFGVSSNSAEREHVV